MTGIVQTGQNPRLTKEQGFLAYLNMDNPEDLDLDDTEVLDRIIPKAAKKLVDRSGFKFRPKKQTSYTGWYVEFYEDDAIELLQHYRDGKEDGPSICWSSYGQKWSEGNYKDGERDGLWTEWCENGQKECEKNYKDGEEVSHLQTSWYESGQKECEETYKDGKRMSAVVWKPNGEKCPVTNFVDGGGVMVIYSDDGTESCRLTFKDGKIR